MEAAGADIESERPAAVSHWRLLADQALLTPHVLSSSFHGQGTETEPFIVEWDDHDPRNPQGWAKWYKWIITVVVAIASLAVSFCSSAYSGGIADMMRDFDISREVAVLGLSLFVVGFALGPLLWAPLSELYGRQVIFFVTFGAYAAFNAGAAGSQNTETVLILRFLAGSFGSSPLTNAGGVIADMFEAEERGLAMCVFSIAPFMGPGIHWASSLAAFLALACLPFPWLFYKYGYAVRVRCKYAAQAEKFAREMRERDLRDEPEDGIEQSGQRTSDNSDGETTKEGEQKAAGKSEE
ncbi:Major facilitator superfamily [Lasiodiplodia theobromae]|uniref:Major facilitator superfamily n=1 Tax=Lasiodiplodia theobromae TaxID=45133 RepID=A0A8H7IS16_9PEZI|nr:Major facilitator superfamily [Lasiodiplodia theobromae]